MPNLSLVIPTYRREGALCDTLADALVQDHPSYEVIVVDQTLSHTDDTRRYLNSVLPRIRLLTRPEPNLPAARNHGVQAAKGGIVVFIDDDVRLPVGFLSAHSANYGDPAVMAVAGAVLAGENKWRHGVPAGSNRRPFCHFRGCWQSDKRMEVCHAQGVNHSYRRVVWEQVGGYDEEFKGSAFREESDFFFRVNGRGMKIVYDPAAWLIHRSAGQGGCWMESNSKVSYSRLYCHAYFCTKNYSGADRAVLFADHLRTVLKGRGLAGIPGSIVVGLPMLVRAWRAADRKVRGTQTQSASSGT